ncbi:antitoxin component YwqK of YwqJK toxin-antitoxin module [Lewinella aquimaris]|uniref:Antitoxin component YwqK of YwqJK toxin-antitoxin module n=1 Tax=Neolewinella aquimaris TaxID=1835722 RepID=A0A840E688_9BACT|nr:membrane-binding protein [Neolewinella aquimaris]MBB4080570.1 antitoxin component YwqK of YwqJK toxin-antitoxin module [Neolewinella aquimaris]
MKCLTQIVLLLNMLLTSCAEKETKVPPTPTLTATSVEIPNISVDRSLLTYDNKASLWTLKDQPYSGYIVSFHQDSTLKEKIGIRAGKKQNQAIRWYADGHLQEVANYQEGKLHGEKQTWSPDAQHVLIAHLHYRAGRPHGEQRQWYPTGELYKKLNLNMGKEAGIQQAFRPNGDLYANYEAKDGRVFGLKKASLCYGLEDGNLTFTK